MIAFLRQRSDQCELGSKSINYPPSVSEGRISRFSIGDGAERRRLDFTESGGDALGRLDLRRARNAILASLNSFARAADVRRSACGGVLSKYR